MKAFLRANSACSLDHTDKFVGKLFDEDIRRQIEQESGALTIRVLRPGLPAPLDGQTGRLIVELDEDARIVRMYCG